MDIKLGLRNGVIFSICLLVAPVVQATTITIDSYDAGTYIRDVTYPPGEGGFHNPGSVGYLVGYYNSDLYRNFFVFSIPSLTGTVTAATLRLKAPSGGYSSADSSETYEVYDVSTSISTLITGGSNLPAIYDDLGSGSVYGTITMTSASHTGNIDITLSSTAIANITAAAGGNFAIGGALTTIGTTTIEQPPEVIFGLTYSTPYVRQLILTTAAVPEPSCLFLFGLGLVGLAGIARMRRRTEP